MPWLTGWPMEITRGEVVGVGVIGCRGQFGVPDVFEFGD